MTTRIAVFGAGSWGTVFAMILADAGCEVSLWARRPELVDTINTTGRNPEYFPDLDLPPGITATTDPAKAAKPAPSSHCSPCPRRRCAPTLLPGLQ